MSENVIVRHCAPTLAGLKTANMFSCTFPNDQMAEEVLRRWDDILSPKGVRVLPLRMTDGKTLVYAYRPDRLREDLCDRCAMRLLHGMDYPCGCPELCLARLIGRVRQGSSVPDEIGLFLGYPPEDVEGFMEKRDCKYSGFWKVYGDIRKAQSLFDSYRQCTREYCGRLAEGATLEQLAVNC